MSSPVEIRGGHGGDASHRAAWAARWETVGVQIGGDPAAQPSVLEVPSSYHRVVSAALPPDAPGCVVAHAYAQLLDDIETGTSTLPDFDHAVRRHRNIETIDRAATSGAAWEREP